MADNVIKFYPLGTAKEPDSVLEKAVGNYDEVMIIGYDKKGELDVRATLGLEHKDFLFMIEVFKLKLLSGDYFDIE